MIKVENLTVKYGERVILNNYSYQFEDNKVYCIMGKSGCGKTTLLRAIAGLLKPYRGTVYYNNQKINRQNREIFMMHQHYTNFPWKTCLQNVLFPIELREKIKPEHTETALALLETVGLGGHAAKYPYELSGGMKQRLSLARVLISRPKLLLMDEPLSALDSTTRTRMQDLILAFHREMGNTLIMVTHDPAEADKMKDVIITF